jgi:hypothetical protein
VGLHYLTIYAGLLKYGIQFIKGRNLILETDEINGICRYDRARKGPNGMIDSFVAGEGVIAAFS